LLKLDNLTPEESNLLSEYLGDEAQNRFERKVYR